MSDRFEPTEETIQDYVDGRLNSADEARVEAYLIEHPEVAATVDRNRKTGQALRRLGAQVLDEPVPARLKDVLKRIGSEIDNEPRIERRLQHLLIAAAVLAVLTSIAVLGLALWDSASSAAL
jgi:anti-sigma factor RsiW